MLAWVVGVLVGYGASLLHQWNTKSALEAQARPWDYLSVSTDPAHLGEELKAAGQGSYEFVAIIPPNEKGQPGAVLFRRRHP
jgi:hypothetical protein